MIYYSFSPLTSKARREEAERFFFFHFPLFSLLQLSHGFSMHPELEGLPKFDIQDIYEKLGHGTRWVI